MDCPDAETLSSLVAGGLPSAERAAVANHAASCDSCHAVIEALMVTAAAPAANVAETLPTGVPPGRSRRDEALRLTRGARIDRYVIESRLGAGGMGVVYAARDPELGRRVAVKLLRPGAPDDRLRREAQALARLSHPNVVAVYDVGEHEGQTFVAMALVEGSNLRIWLQAPRSTEAILHQLLAAGRGLAAAHGAGIIHRDLKPDNVFVADGGVAQVGDFGLARELGATDGFAVSVGDAGDPLITPPLTRTGVMLGTPAYMAPEQAAGEATAASDQFSFCVTAWEALFGARPFAGATLEQILAAARAGRFVTPPSDRDVPARVQRALERGLAADPAARFPSLNALLLALAPRPRPWPWIVAGASMLAAVGIVTAVVITGRGAGVANDPAAQCAGTEHLLEGVWGPARRLELERALAARPDADVAVTPRILAAIDDYAAGWIELRHDACVAFHVRHELRPEALEARAVCLDDRAHALGGLVEEIAVNDELDPTVAWRMVGELRAVDRCRQPDALGAAPGPRSPEVAAVYDRLLAVDALSGAWEDAVQIRVDAEGLADPALLLDALLLEARLALRCAEIDAAEVAARRALTLAETNRNDVGKATAGALLAEALALLRRVREAEGQIPLAKAALARGGDDWQVALAIVRAQAGIALAADDAAAEIAALRKILDELRRRLADDNPLVLDAALELSSAYGRDGQTQRFQEVIGIMHAAYAASRPALEAAALRAHEAATVAIGAGDLARVVEQVTLRLALYREMAAADPGRRGDLALALLGLALFQSLAGDATSALASFREGALVLRELGDDPEAVEPLASALDGVGRLTFELGDAAAALAPLREALALTTSPERRQSATTELGRALLADGKPAEAITLLEPLLRELDAEPEPPVIRRAHVSFTLAQALWDTGGERDRSRARSLAGDAARDFAAGRDELATKPLHVTNRRRAVERLAAVVEWQRQHPL